MEVLRRKHPSKSSFKAAKGIIWYRIIKMVDKHWDHMKMLQENIDNVRRANREINAIKNTIGDSPTKVEVIIDSLKNMSKEDVTKENFNRSRMVAKENR